MSFNPDSIKSQANTFINNVAAKSKEYIAELQENPTEFMKTNGKTAAIAAVFFVSFIFSAPLTALACFGGFVCSKNVCKIESEYEELFKNLSLESKIISGALLTSVLLFTGQIVLPIAIGAHVGMLLSDKYLSAEGITPTPNPV